MTRKLRFEPRVAVPPWLNVTVPAACVLLALAVGAVLYASLGVNPWVAYGQMFAGALGSGYGLSETIVKAIPLTMTGLSCAIAFRMLLWNIGAEGQLFMGALATTAAVRFCFVDNAFWMFWIMFLASLFAGGLWGTLAGWLRARWNVNEIISTLMLNYIAILGVDYFIYGPWKDPASLGFPMTAPFPDAARLLTFGSTRIHIGLVTALVIAAIFRVILRWTKWGYEIRVIGENPKAAHYAGMDITRNILLVMFLSGAVAGLAGMGEVAGLEGRLSHGFSPGYGFTGIIVAWLARLNPLAIPVVAFLLGILFVGGEALQLSMDLPLASTQVLQGLILLFVLGGEFFTHYRVRLIRKEEVV